MQAKKNNLTMLSGPIPESTPLPDECLTPSERAQKRATPKVQRRGIDVYTTFPTYGETCETTVHHYQKWGDEEPDEVRSGLYRSDLFGLVETYEERESWFFGIPLPFLWPRTDTPLAQTLTDALMAVFMLTSLALLSGIAGK